jgi:hypothetical protein
MVGVGVVLVVVVGAAAAAELSDGSERDAAACRLDADGFDVSADDDVFGWPALEGRFVRVAPWRERSVEVLQQCQQGWGVVNYKVRNRGPRIWKSGVVHAKSKIRV